MSTTDYYTFLGLSRDATDAEIQGACREKAAHLQAPDMRGTAHAKEQMRLLSAIFQTLTDPQKRQAYDASLPAPGAPRAPITDMQELWAATCQVFVERADRFTPTINAIQSSVPLALDDEALLVVGIDPAKSNLIGYVTATTTMHQIKGILSELYGQPLDFRIIPGTHLQDWLNVKIGEEKIRQKKQQAQAQTTTTTVPGAINLQEAWETFNEKVQRAWTVAENRAFPQSRARFVLAQLTELSRLEDLSRGAALPDDTLQKNLARGLEKIANTSSVDATVIALEYLQFRARHMGGF